jgi:predicted nuclease of predicted toxin-antitoxin system
VKFLVDANLPPRLCSWLRSHHHEAEHVFDRNLLTATDTQIWERSRVENLVIFSKDTDFYDRALLFGTHRKSFMWPLVIVATPGFLVCWCLSGMTSNGLSYPGLD